MAWYEPFNDAKRNLEKRMNAMANTNPCKKHGALYMGICGRCEDTKCMKCHPHISCWCDYESVGY